MMDKKTTCPTCEGLRPMMSRLVAHAHSNLPPGNELQTYAGGTLRGGLDLAAELWALIPGDIRRRWDE